ncbi:MAG: BBP7 family outer membrane beta-barrel protein, partial [Pirellulaceae bacterium]|nr:BBP7 family outer membrane beta-barrel protein [Pirellulaceae bacterium]
MFRSASHALRLVLLLASVGMPSLALGGKGAEPAETDEFAFDEEKGGGGPDAVCPAEACWTPKPWVRAEYLLWWIDGFDAPPLATTSPVGTDRDLAGQLDQLSTAILLGGQTLTNDASSGGRIRFGLWLDAGSTCGVEAGYLGLGRNSSTFEAGSPLPSILARPFTNLESGFEGADAELVAYPSLFDGSLQIRRETELQGVEVLYRQALSRSCRLQ